MTAVLDTPVHQIVITAATEPHRITVWCTCQRRRKPYGDPIGARRRFPAADAIAAWRAWHEDQGIVIA